MVDACAAQGSRILVAPVEEAPAYVAVGHVEDLAHVGLRQAAVDAITNKAMARLQARAG